MPKQSKLDEQAVIYQPREKQTEKEKLKEMNFRGKISYLWEYYKIHAFVIVAVIALISYIIYKFVTPDVKTQFYAAIIDSAVNREVLEEYKQEFSDYLQLDPELESVELNDSFYLSSDGEYTSNLTQILSTYIAAGEVDVIIAPESAFNNYAYYGYTAKLSDELPTNVYSSLTDYFYLTETEDDPNHNAYGIYLTDSNLFGGLEYNSEPYVLGIVANYPNEENTIDFIRFLFKDK